ncbi:Signal-induced proliferation-associated 1-like protein 2 [Tribolium castaneum]|uniref:Signal-induced proliferation-associated 1-like protein 2 n=1 Tax=Tribolium castaneum TaxID=7070 RepID=A0A139WIV1_TRICA|nr:Signal-induced proliferation-associated 1-like protein 2 [Tribolium castaneum]
MIGLQECGPAPPRAPVSGSRARDRAAQAVDYYNTHVHRAWANAGLSRSSFNDRHQSSTRRHHLAPEQLYRSNSSLELLDHNGRPSNPSTPTLKREYGSHGSIDVIDRPPAVGESFFAMLQDYQPAVLGAIAADQRSPGPAEYLRGKVDVESVEDVPSSPKSRVKLSRFWSNGQVNVKNQRQAMDDSMVNTSSSSCSVICSAEAEEIARRRAFSHYDCQSLTTNLNYTARLRRILAKRRNTTTGASAASMLAKSFTSDGDSGEEDNGDGQNNDLVQSCPFFRNEIGGEEERIVSLTRLQSSQGLGGKKPLHRPPLAYGVAVLEFPPGETHWRHSTCPYQRLPRPIESVDQGALYYRKYFYGQEHQNWFGMDEQLGPVAISIRREKVLHPDNQLSSSSIMQYQYRLVIRTSELQTFRGAILEDAIPSIKASSSSKTFNIKEVLEYVAPEIQLSSLRLGVQNQQTEEQLLKLDEQGLNNHYKVGVMYCKADQSSEEEMYNNEEAGPAFVEFLETIGKKVRLKGFAKYKAGLDNKSDSTGLYSVYSQYQDCEIMFHVSTMLPFTPNNRQQLLRKRHIGNDIVTIVFQEPGALPFTPKGIRSQFQHVFIVVQAINPCTENTHYKVAVSRSKDVEVFGPPIKDGAIFPKGKAFAEFLLAKVVNAENAAHRSEKFVTMATRTRQEYLKELVTNSSTSTPVDTHQKFSIFSSKKKDKIRPRFIPDACQRGAILWQVLLDDSGQSQRIECFLGISTDSLVLIEETSKQIVFVTPCKSILGWSTLSNGLRIYHHQGECMTIHMRDGQGDRDELMEVMQRLQAVTQGVLAKELSLKRNIMGQLGFHVQPDGIVTLVESSGEAWHGGLRQNSRLVEICKVAVSTLTYDQMVDLLKTSIVVTLTVIPPLPDGSPRKGCTLQNCKYNEGNYEGDYENLDDGKSRKAPQMQQAGNHRRIYERSFSPPRSSNSSGYGTGSSSKSFHNPEGTLTSSSSGHSGDDKWYDVLQELEVPPVPQKTPSRTNNTFPTPKRTNQIQVSHNHFGPQQIHHSKVQISHSLPLQHVNYSQPLTAVVHNNTDYESYNKEKNNVKQQSDYVMRQLNDFRLNDGHSTDSSMYGGLGSEDELSNGSGNVSPRSRRAKQLTSNSRNHSPRSVNGEAKLRPGVTPRSSNRNSANLSSSNFQEELLRLINPDSIEASTEPKETTSHSSSNLSHKTQPEVILTMARPATVISNASTTSSPLPAEFKGSKDELNTKTKSVVSLEEYPVPEDWPTLVDTATRVLMQVASDSYKRDEGKWDEEAPIDASITSSVSSSTSVPELQNHVTDLESSLKRETRRRLSLENEVRRLKEENKKLKDQAQSAVQQLRKFTEWFFKNVQRQ